MSPAPNHHKAEQADDHADSTQDLQNVEEADHAPIVTQ
jgi:hypothetical protein